MIDPPLPQRRGGATFALHRWRDPSVLALGLLAAAAGFGQFGAVAALGDVASHFGHLTHGATIAEQAGLSGTQLGLGLAILRLASLGGLVFTGLADRLGRRRVLLWTCGLGLVMTFLAAGSPTYWWFVAIFAAGRPLLSSTAALTQVSAAEETSTKDRAKAIALVAAGYGVGSGLTAVIHGLAKSALGFRGLFVLAVVPLVGLVFLARLVTEPSRYSMAAGAVRAPLPILGAIAPQYRRRLAIVLLLTFAISVVTGPATSFFFVYAQNVVGLSGPAIALLVVAAGASGLVGLLLGRFLADRIGRRIAAGIPMVVVSLVGMVTYSGSRLGAIGGYLVAVLAAATFAPAAGAFTNELFPTSVRASVAGWEIAASVAGATVGLLAFGAVADVGNRFGLAAIVVFSIGVPAALLFALLPETRGREPEELWAPSS